MDTLVLYAIRNRDGQWLRAKGYNGSGNSWVDNLQEAKIYPRIGPARAQVTYWAKQYPQYGIPQLVELNISEMKVLDEDSRVRKSLDKIEKEKLAYEERSAKWKLEAAQRELEAAQRKIEALKVPEPPKSKTTVPPSPELIKFFNWITQAEKEDD